MEIPSGNFYCQDCDPVGTTKYLIEYFDSVEEKKAECKSSREFVEGLVREHMELESGGDPSGSPDVVSSSSRNSFGGVTCTSSGISNRNTGDDVTGTGTCDNANAYASNSSGGNKRKHDEIIHDNADNVNGNGNGSGIMDAPPISEISRMAVLYAAAMDDSKWRNENCTSEDRATTATTALSASTDSSSSISPPEGINREFLIGKIAKVYCTRDNQYHTGRIINWRSAIEPGIDPKYAQTQFYGEGSIGCTEFLVRFAAGTNGRKKALLQWLILEEHSAAISSSLVMAMRDKGRGMYGWRPGQLMLRTCIELIPIRNLLAKKDQYGLVTFFDLDTSIYLDLNMEAVGIASDAFQREFRKKVNLTPAKKAKSFQAVLQLLDALMGCSDVEIQEQMRTRAWYGLHLKNLYHERALTLPDEYYTDLYMDGETEKECESESETKTKTETKTRLLVRDKEDADGVPVIQLCPTIQRGLDKQWIASRLTNVSGDNSLDAMASMKVARLSKPKSVAMALINEQHALRNKRTSTTNDADDAENISKNHDNLGRTLQTTHVKVTTLEFE